MRAAELFIQCLENEHVEYIFGIPGEEDLDVMDALLDSSIHFISVRHEHGAAFMADVYGRLTGKPGVCLVTLGPGATNLNTGVADANRDRAPIVAIAGQRSTHRLHKESHQILDLVNLFEPISNGPTNWRDRPQPRAASPGPIPRSKWRGPSTGCATALNCCVTMAGGRSRWAPRRPPRGPPGLHQPRAHRPGGDGERLQPPVEPDRASGGSGGGLGLPGGNQAGGGHAPVLLCLHRPAARRRGGESVGELRPGDLRPIPNDDLDAAIQRANALPVAFQTAVFGQHLDTLMRAAGDWTPRR